MERRIDSISILSQPFKVTGAGKHGYSVSSLSLMGELHIHEGIAYDGIEEIWPDYPTKEDFFFHEDEY